MVHTARKGKKVLKGTKAKDFLPKGHKFINKKDSAGIFTFPNPFKNFFKKKK